MSACQVPSRVKGTRPIFAFCVYVLRDFPHAHEKSISATDLQDIDAVYAMLSEQKD